jgi:peptidoglycan/LPS O-acetylase OafA/YrhL
MSVGTRNTWIDLLRGVSIILVLLHHFNIPYHLDDTALSQLFGWQSVHAVVRNGNYGVTMFFVISGYLITSNARMRWGTLANINAGVFYRLRVARIIPCLLLLMAAVNVLAAMGVTVFQNHPEDGPPVSFWLVNFASLTFWMNILMATRVGWVNYALGILWSLSVEEVFYLSFPIACLLLKRPVFLVMFWSVFILIGPIWRILHQDDEAQFLYSYLASFDGIAIGCCTAILASHTTLQGRWIAPAGTLAALAMAALYLILPIGVTNVYGVTLMALGTAFLILLTHDWTAGVPVDRTRISAVLAWFGRLSYELYLFHLIVLGLIRSAYPVGSVAGNEKLILLVVYVSCSTLLAAIVGRAYSEPLNRIIRSSFNIRRPQPA